ncbi:MAG: oligosaccharide flippase family protein [Ignavibacteria bacterium]|nr:oligosaccharide flippase family protein [Ignavibacteria bacterium]
MQHKIKTLASDTLVYGVSTIAGRFLTFMLTPLYSNYLTAGQIGDVTAIYALIAFVNIVYSVGLEPAFMRFWEAENEPQNKRVFSISLFIILAIGAVVTALTVLFAPWIAASSFLQLEADGANLIRMAAFIPLFDSIVLIPFAQLRMQRNAKQFAVFRLLAIVINVSLNVVFVVVLGTSIQGVVLSGLLSSGITSLFFLPLIVRNSTTIRNAFNGTLFKEMLRFGLPTVPSSFSSIMVQVADRPIMLMLTSSAVLGMYQTNFRLALPMMMFVTVFEYAWKPFYLNHRDDPEAKQLFARVFTIFTIVCGAVFLVTTAFMPYVVTLPFLGGKFINPLYWSGLYIVPIVMFAYYFNGVFINMAAGFHITKKTKWFPLATGVAAIANVVVTFALVPSMDIGGAAWAKVAAYVSSAVILYVVQQRIYPMKYEWGKVFGIFGICALIYTTFILTSHQNSLALVVRISALPAYAIILVLTGIVHHSTLTTLKKLVLRK